MDWSVEQNAISFAFEFGLDFDKVGKNLQQGIETFTDILKANYNSFSMTYMKDKGLCIKSLATVQNTLILSSLEGQNYTEEFAPDDKKCFNFLNNQTVILTYANSLIPPKMIDISALPAE